MPSLDWIVKNGLNKDVERQHLNKILADIRSSVGTVEKQVTTVTNIVNSGSSSGTTKDIVGDMVSGNIETGIDVTYDFQKKVLDFVVANFIIALAGDVTGEGTVTGLSDVTITTTLDPSLIGVTEAPIDNFFYWRRNAAWEGVSNVIANLEMLETSGFPALTADEFEPVWNARVITGTTDRIDVADGDGVGGNPTIDFIDEGVQDLMASTLTDSATVTWDYDDIAGTIEANVVGGVGGGVLPVVTGEVPPVLVYFDDGSLMYSEIE